EAGDDQRAHEEERSSCSQSWEASASAVSETLARDRERVEARGALRREPARTRTAGSRRGQAPRPNRPVGRRTEGGPHQGPGRALDGRAQGSEDPGAAPDVGELAR